MLLILSILHSGVIPLPDTLRGTNVIELQIPEKPPEPKIWNVDTFIQNALDTDVSYIKQTDELMCLAKNIYFEARNQDNDGRLAIAFVTQARVTHKRWRDTICGVVYQHKQFSWYSDGKPDTPRHPIAWKESLQIAAAKLNSYKFDPQFYSKPTVDITLGATHYHADYVEPSWSVAMNKTAHIETHIFYQ
jgi:spore germination cell wall hydrolase CwlJ-like protein